MRTIRQVILSTTAILVLAVPSVVQADEPSVNGQILLPEGATLDGAVAWTLAIQDTSLADAPAVVVGATGGAVTDPAAVEIPYLAGYDPDSIEEGSTYTLSARIVDEAGDLLFINDTSIPVITDGAPVDDVDVPVIAVGAAPAGDARVIELEADATLRFLQDGEQVLEIPVTPGETVLFRVNNTADFAHNFYIGADEDLQVASNTTDTGIPEWESGVQELEWVVPADISGLRFACTVAGHYLLMQGDFTITP
jgi:uncharacterized lipoprotein YbaY